MPNAQERALDPLGCGTLEIALRAVALRPFDLEMDFQSIICWHAPSPFTCRQRAFEVSMCGTYYLQSNSGTTAGVGVPGLL
jgi:hypothetical protein